MRKTGRCHGLSPDTPPWVAAAPSKGLETMQGGGQPVYSRRVKKLLSGVSL